MKYEIKKGDDAQEYWFEEGCFITEVANDKGDEYLSIAMARVKPHTSTKYHMLEGVSERYVILSGSGIAEIGDEIHDEVRQGDIVRIPSNTPQRIINTGDTDLVFYVICAPPFTKSCYVSLEEG